MPIGVVIPETIEDVVATVAVCRRHGRPILSRGGGTSLTGGCCNVAVVMDWSKYLQQGPLRSTRERKLARVQPGTVLDILRTEAEKHRLTFAPDPSTHTAQHPRRDDRQQLLRRSLAHGPGTGRTSDQVHELDILLYDGTRMTVGPTSEDELERIIAAGGRKGEIYAQAEGPPRPIRRRDPPPLSHGPARGASRATTSTTSCPRTGSTWRGRSAGTEGTCVTMLEASLHLVPARPSSRCWCSVIPTSMQRATMSPEILEFKPTGLEGLDDILVAT